MVNSDRSNFKFKRGDSAENVNQYNKFQLVY